MRNDAGINGDAQRIEQIAWMLFLKVYDTKEQDWEFDDENYESIIPEECRWSNWAHDESGKGLTGDKLLDFVNNSLFPTLKALPVDANTPIKKAIVQTTFSDANQYMKDGVLLRQVINVIDELQLDDYKESHAFGEIYENILKELQSAGSAGEFYTPRAVTDFMAQMIHPKIGEHMADPAMGSGSLLLNVRHYIQDVDSIAYYGQEIKTSTYNLARMNMIIHGIAATNQHLRNADTLDRDWPSDEVTNFDGVMMNPPYSQHWSADKGFESDPRFSDYGVLAPKSKADYAFLLHGLYHLKESGTMGIVLPHGVLFRGAAEGKIRQKLLEKGYIYAVIGLPAGIFYSTGIPTIIMVLKKDRPGRDVLFIDGSQEFEKGKAKNTLTQANIQKLFQAYTDRKDVNKFAHVASFEEIQENDFNLNIPRYVDTSEPEPEIDLGEVNREMADTNHQIQAAEKELADMMEELTTDDPKKAKDLQDLLHLFQ